MKKKNNEDFLKAREVFHLQFLRSLGYKIKTQHYALKGGSNLRFFFGSCRYSEDMDLDVSGLRVDVLRDAVMGVLQARAFQDTLKSFGIEKFTLPDMSMAKQTETTQRFKIHLLTSGNEDLFTKIEFSRRGMKEGIVMGPVADAVLRAYKMPPLLVPHYTKESAVAQKVSALAMRSVLQARDIFDLFILSSQYEKDSSLPKKLVNVSLWAKAHDHVFKVTFEHFRDSVISYLTAEDQVVYGTPQAWDEIKLKAANFIEEIQKFYA